ncbi:hypothetical protein [Salinispora arenicola]|uniref:hypothetical protein n=1 Tax=Salinispora arenicola TaxID=168697 RepID=UPI0003808F7B|nr:hypothetical protein [Salinispora arenicola]
MINDRPGDPCVSVPSTDHDDADTQALWTTDDVVAYLGLRTRASARAQLSAWGIRPCDREPGRSGLNRYQPQPIREIHQKRRGQGWRAAARRQEAQ